MENTETKKEAKSLKDLVPIDPAVVQFARQTAYNLYQAEKYDDLEIILKGLLAVDAKDAWALSTYASMLRKQLRFKEALILMETAHSVDPNDQNIRKMRDELVGFLKKSHELKQQGA
jgi:hypothetical protein